MALGCKLHVAISFPARMPFTFINGFRVHLGCRLIPSATAVHLPRTMRRSAGDVRKNGGDQLMQLRIDLTKARPFFVKVEANHQSGNKTEQERPVPDLNPP